MTLAGWTLMVVSLTSVVVLTSYCYWRVLRNRGD